MPQKIPTIEAVKILPVTSLYRGVTYDSRHRSKPWRAEMRHGYRHIYIGNYSSAEEAARAYDLKALALKGAKAKLNFQ